MMRSLSFCLSGLAFLALGLGCASKAPPKISFGSPEETFASWKSSVERLDTDALISCYAQASRDGMRDEIRSTSQDGLKAMQRETKETKFEIEKVVYEGHRAFLRVQRSYKGARDIEVINMILENGGWRLVP